MLTLPRFLLLSREKKRTGVTTSEPNLQYIRLHRAMIVVLLEMFTPHLLTGVRMRMPWFLVRTRHLAWLGTERVSMRWRLLEVVGPKFGAVLVEGNGVAEVADCGVGCCERQVARDQTHGGNCIPISVNDVSQHCFT